MINKFRGWNTVFGFTFRQSTKKTGYRLVTGLVALLIIGLCILINILVAKPDSEEKPSPITEVIVLDQSGLPPINYKLMSPELNTAPYNHINFVESKSDSREGTIQELSESKSSIALFITGNEEEFFLETVVPENSDLKEKHVNKLMKPIQVAFESNKMLQSGLSMEQLVSVIKPTTTSYQSVGEDTNEAVYIIRIFLPMIFGFTLYMMLLLYGQDVSKTVSSEKTSKLMETLLTSIHPYAMILGKVLATTAIAVIQFVVWILSILIGLLAGNYIAGIIYPDFENLFIEIFKFVTENLGDQVFSPASIILAILVFTLGFVFYCVLASLSGAMVSKPEDTSVTQVIFVIPVLISFLITYLAPIANNQELLSIARYVPLTSPFCVPVDVMTGAISLWEALISFGILAVFSLVVIILSAKLYRGFVLYTGQKFTFKLMKDMLKKNN